jgi:hypothetical protein
MRENLIKALESHDWKYEYADDYRAYQRGSNERKAIYAMIKDAKQQGWGDDADALYNEYKK